jgi:hypothetical protein
MKAKKQRLDKTIVQRELKKIQSKDGRLTADATVQAARDPKNPLHKAFEWDNTRAAHKWRLEQARTLIAWAETKVRYQDREYTVPAYLRDPQVKPSEQGYRSIESIRDDPDDARAVLVEEFVRAGAHLRRARNVARALGLDGEVEEVIQTVDRARMTFINLAGRA